MLVLVLTKLLHIRH